VFNAELVIKDRKGSILGKYPVRNITEMIMKQKPIRELTLQVVEELKQKIGHILSQRGYLQENEAIPPVKRDSTVVDAEEEDLGLFALFNNFEDRQKSASKAKSE